MKMEVPEIPNLPRHRRAKNQPKDSTWRQQKLSAQRPVLTIQAAFKYVMCLGLIIFGLGLLLWFEADKSKEFVYDYTECLTKNGTKAEFLAQVNAKPTCSIDLTITEDFKGDVKFYYQLDGFYQNFRTYSTSRNDLQLLGDLFETDQCEPYDCVAAEGYVLDVNTTCKLKEYNASRAIPIVPCGTIANSMFNDSFELTYHQPDGTSIPVPFTVDGIMAHVERIKKFRNPHDYPDDNPIRQKYPGAMCDQFRKTTKPPNWQSSICELGVFNASEDDLDIGWALNNIDFQVWMKTAALPNFRKPYRSLDKNHDPFNDGDNKAVLPKGNYTLLINYNYNVIHYKIKKSFVIANPSWIGPRNFFLPTLYMITGCFILVAMSVLFIVAKVKARFSKETT